MSQPNPSRDTRQPALSRRTVFAGVGVAGAAAAAATVLPGAVRSAAPAVAAAPQPASTGYQLTDHVKRYYQTARV
nr:formate dehydrogenase [Variovorax boronicumulans]